LGTSIRFDASAVACAGMRFAAILWYCKLPNFTLLLVSVNPFHTIDSSIWLLTFTQFYQNLRQCHSLGWSQECSPYLVHLIRV
jgi:hypothetical protein